MRNINRLNFRDIQALNGLRVCGYAMRADMEKIISCNRVEAGLSGTACRLPWAVCADLHG